jgi:hypothetical protein
VASRAKMRQSVVVDLTDQHFLWASLVWGAVGSGYLLYGWRQRAAIPFAAGAALTAISFFLPALWMSLAAVAILCVGWWLRRQE